MVRVKWKSPQEGAIDEGFSQLGLHGHTRQMPAQHGEAPAFVQSSQGCQAAHGGRHSWGGRWREQPGKRIRHAGVGRKGGPHGKTELLQGHPQDLRSLMLLHATRAGSPLAVILVYAVVKQM